MKRGGCRAVILDWDDTYVQTRSPKYSHHKEVAEGYKFELTDEVLDKHWGSGLLNELPHFYGHPDGVTIDEMLAAFNALTPKYPKPLQPDTLRFHRALSSANILRALVSHHLTENVVIEMEMAGLDPSDFVAIHGSDVIFERKPSPAAFTLALNVLDEHNVAPEDVVGIGDTLEDGEAARDARMQFIGVATGRISVAQFMDAGFHAEPNLDGVRGLLVPNPTTISV